jgi:hypothetical protein
MARRAPRSKIYKEILSRGKPKGQLTSLRKGKQHKGRRKAAGM